MYNRRINFGNALNTLVTPGQLRVALKKNYGNWITMCERSLSERKVFEAKNVPKL